MDTLASYVDFQATGLHVTREAMDVWLAQLEAGEDAPPPECHTQVTGEDSGHE
jgi:hypothetical protein